MYIKRLQIKNVMLIDAEIAAYIKLHHDLKNQTVPDEIKNMSPEQFAVLAKMAILPKDYGSVQDALDIIADCWEDWPAIDRLYSVEQFQGTTQTVLSNSAVVNHVNTDPTHIAYIKPQSSQLPNIESEFKSLFESKLPPDFDFWSHIVNLDGVRKPAGVWHNGVWYNA